MKPIKAIVERGLPFKPENVSVLVSRKKGILGILKFRNITSLKLFKPIIDLEYIKYFFNLKYLYIYEYNGNITFLKNLNLELVYIKKFNGYYTCYKKELGRNVLLY